jgi:hypothetical protein
MVADPAQASEPAAPMAIVVASHKISLRIASLRSLGDRG